MIDLRSFPCLIVGGGAVALRKVQSLLEFNAQVTVVSPRFCKGLSSLAARGKIRTVKHSYSNRYLESNKIVFCATDNAGINKAVSNDCKRAGVLLNAADNPAMCDFIMPAILKRGQLTISVSSQGTAPFYTKETKRRLDEALPPAAGDIAELAAEFRRRLLSEMKGSSQSTKVEAYKRFLKTDWDKILTGKGKKGSQTYINELLKELHLT